MDLASEKHLASVGLYYVGVRAYDPRTARWLQRDPIDATSGDPNLYRYCGNDPINRMGPSGTDVDIWDFVPIIDSGREIVQGIQNGSWEQVALGVGGLLLDISTGGASAVAKGVVKTGQHNPSKCRKKIEEVLRKICQALQENADPLCQGRTPK